MPPPSSLPPDLQRVAQLFDAEPTEVQELFQYALAMLLVEDGKAQIAARPLVDSREHLTFRTIADELFTIAKPRASENSLERMRAMACEILAEDSKPR